MKKLVYSLVIVAAALFAVDRLGGQLMGWASRHSDDVFSPKFRYLLDSVHEDVVLLGASRCHHHYVPAILADSLGMTVYNAGIGGADNIFSHYIVLSHILERTVPKVVCLEVMPSDYNRQPDPFAVISFFAPLWGHSAAADSVFSLAGTAWRYRLSHLYRYNAKAPSTLWGLALNRQQGSDHGYMPLPEPRQHPDTLTRETPDLSRDPLKTDYLERLANLCRQKDIRLVFVVSPKYTQVGADHYAPLRTFADRHHIPFLDYHTAALYHDHPDYFKDAVHLTDRGARLFSARFAHDLRQVLQLSD